MRDTVQLAVRVRLGALTPDDVAVQLLIGPLDAAGDIVAGQPVDMRATASNGDIFTFEAGQVPCCHSGAYGFTARVLPRRAEMGGKFLPGLIAWAR